MKTVGFKMKKKVIIEYLEERGFRHSLKGYDYIVRAIELGLINKNVVFDITKILYPQLAYEFTTSPTCIERNIRHSIETAMIDKKSNSEFLAHAVDDIYYGII